MTVELYSFRIDKHDNYDLNRKLNYQVLKNVFKVKTVNDTCLVFFFREGRPSVILYDTSEDNDININDTILRTIEAEGGGIGSPRTESPSPANSASSTPQRVLSPLPRPVDTTEGSIPVKKLDTNSNPVIQTNQTNGFTSSVSSQQVSPNVSQSSELSQNSDASVNSDISMKSKASEFLDNSQNVSRPILGRSPGGQKNSNDNESVPRPFQIPEVGEYLDVHVAFVHDPSNFVVSITILITFLNQSIKF
jgi:hypothetical protein